MDELVVDTLYLRDRGPYSFRNPGGSCLGLHGTSGAGKSLLLRALADLDPNQGTISLGLLHCRDVPAPKWRQMVGLLPAESCWWYDRVGEHIQNLTPDWQQVLAELDLPGEALEWTVARLSTGERQRLAVFRLLQNSPQALLLDEPTANLDKVNCTRVEQLLTAYRLEHKIPVLWVSHDQQQLARVADHTMEMDRRGRLSGKKGPGKK
jgi:ABC-type iron transport system FetAB ATPase subunit